jgi:hypothetical protein
MRPDIQRLIEGSRDTMSALRILAGVSEPLVVLRLSKGGAWPVGDIWIGDGPTILAAATTNSLTGFDALAELLPLRDIQCTVLPSSGSTSEDELQTRVQDLKLRLTDLMAHSSGADHYLAAKAVGRKGGGSLRVPAPKVTLRKPVPTVAPRKPVKSLPAERIAYQPPANPNTSAPLTEKLAAEQPAAVRPAASRLTVLLSGLTDARSGDSSAKHAPNVLRPSRAGFWMVAPAVLSLCLAIAAVALFIISDRIDVRAEEAASAQIDKLIGDGKSGARKGY